MSQGLCPSCGAAVSLTTEQTQGNCAYCRTVMTRSDAEARFAEVKASTAGEALVIADFCLGNAEYERALSFYDKATKQDEKSGNAWFGRGICLAHIEDQEFLDLDIRQIDAHQAISSWETAIQLAANPECMGRRAAKLITEVVSDELDREDREPRKTWRKLTHADTACHLLLSWALKRDPKSESLLNIGAKFYSRAAPCMKSWAQSVGIEVAGTYPAEMAASAATFLKSLQEINPAAARECEAALRKAQYSAEAHYKLKQQQQRAANETYQKLNDRFDAAKSAAGKREALDALNRFLDGLPEGVFPEKRAVQPQPEAKQPEQLAVPASSPAPHHLTNPSKRILTGLCAIFLGWLGVHKFMLGYTKEGIIQLIIGVLCCVSALIGLIEGIIYLTKSDEEFNKTYVQAKRAWF